MDEGKEGKERVTAMRKLSEQEFERIVGLLKEGKPLPEDYTEAAIGVYVSCP